MLDKIIDLKNRDNSVKEFSDSVRSGIPSAVFGVCEAFKYYLAGSQSFPVLYIVKDDITAHIAEKAIREFSSKKVVYIPQKDETLLISKAFSKDTLYKRLVALENLSDADVVVTTFNALMQNVAKNLRSQKIVKGQDIVREDLISKLVGFGYIRVESVEEKGTFAVRGDIVDIFPIDRENPVRVDFFGDTVENIKSFDIETRKNLGMLNGVKILQIAEFTDFSFLQDIKATVRRELENCKSGKDRLRVVAGDLLNGLESGDLDALSVFFPLSENCGNILDLMPENTLVIFDEAKRIYDSALLIEKEFTERFDALYNSGEIFSFMKGNMLGVQELTERIKKFNLSAFQGMSTAIPFFSPLKLINPEVSAVSNYHLDFNEVYNDIKNWTYSGYTVVVCAGNLSRAEKFCFDLSNEGVASSIDGKELKGVCVSSEELSFGMVFHEEKLALIGSGNLFTKVQNKVKYKRKQGAFFTAPEVGDYCVHEVHGIGRVLGNKKISTTEGTKDYLSVEYFGGDILYIPVEQMDILTRYLGGDKKPKLSKIGGKDFEKIKKAARESIKKMSFDLKKLYSERNAALGYKFEEQAELQEAFNDAFPFEETVDQAAADQDIKEDMLGGKVMDRLVCGDVGFGKTEVAFRAVFRTIANGKQAAVLAPTTILTEQHYNSAKERFKDFGVRIEVLNRFKSAKEQKNIIERLKAGEVDLIIGTHRLLSKDVGFYDLGLLVLDEEQRFGVEHKEKIKLIKKDVDTLTLTATPIPRTLHMSLSGIRDISTINTPPKKRLPVQTYVTEETPALIKDAVIREINRGGQVFVLYNRVESINSFADYIASIVPNVKMTVVHGQMDEKEMEKSIMSFYNGQTDLLVSTTIIENGIDLPRANTLIVIDADRLGLSTLYQLKGRVGRSDRLAYAYFTFKREKVLSDTAYERLNAITDFTEMGSGIKIAMRDLEIRGAGNVLGAEQHGHMDKIGYELYSKLLREELSGEEEIIPDLDIRVSAFIPDNYIEGNGSRMDAYKEIAELSSESQAEEFIKYISDAFGKVPEEVINLINIALVKSFASKKGVTAITVKKEEVSLTFASFKAFSDDFLMKKIDGTEGVKISMRSLPKVEFEREFEDNAKMLNKIKLFLTQS